MIKEHDRAVLTKAIPDQGLTAGDVGIVVRVQRYEKKIKVQFLKRARMRRSESSGMSTT